MNRNTAFIALLLLAACKSPPATRDRYNTVHEDTEKLREALRSGNFAAAKEALRAKANPNESYYDGKPWLFIALERGFDWADLFYDHGANLDVRNDSDFTALMLMTDLRNHEAMRWLLKHNADPNYVGGKGFSALLLAYIHDDATSVKILKSAGAREDIFTHAVSGDAAALSQLLKAGADPNAIARGGSSALMYAAGYGRVECVRVLLEYKAHVNERSPGDQRTPFLNVVKSDLPNKLEVLSALIQGGADINLSDIRGITALIVAARRQDYDVVKFLVDAGADLNAKTKIGARALSYVTDLEVEKLMLSKGAKCGDKPRFTCKRGGLRTETAQVIAADALHLRNRPSIEGEKLLLMPKGAKVVILSREPAIKHQAQDGQSGVWYRVRYRKREGYAFSAFLDG